MMKSASAFLLISALLHIAAVLASGFSAGATALLVTAVLYLCLYMGLMRGMRWVAWITFLLMFVGMSVALSGAMTPGGPPGWAMWGIFAADLLVTLTLLGALWLDRDEAEEA